MKKRYFLKTVSGILLAFILFASGNLLAQNRNYLSFDGSNDYLKYTSDATLQTLNGKYNYTLEAWVYIPTGASTGANLFRRTYQFVVYYGTNNRLYFAVYYNGNYIYYHSNDNALTNNTWHHIAIVRDNSSSPYLHMYIDGVDQISITTNGYGLVSSNTNNLYIGNNGNNGGYLKCYLDEIRLKTVSENLSDLHYSKYENQYTTDANTAALFHFNEGSGNTVNSVTSVYATVNGATWTAWNANAHLPLAHEWTGASTTDWATSGNWNGDVPAAANDVIIPSGLTNYPLISGDATTPSQCNNVIIESGAILTIPVGKALTVNGNFTNNGTAAGLVVLSDNTGTGSLIVKGSVTGDATVQRYMTNYTTNTDGWHFLSAPVSNFTISGSDFEPGTGEDLYEFGESATSEPWLNYRNGSFGDNQFQTGKGYLVAYASGTSNPKTFTGNINTGTVTKSLSFTSGSAGEGWNLLGNPYTSAIDWDELTTTGNVDGTVYVLQATDGSYISWNGSAGDLTDGIIPAMQGFFVHRTATATGQSVTMETADQVHDATNYYKASKALAENSLKITLSNSEASNNTYIQIRDDATKGFDNAIDGYKLFGFGSTPELYTQIGNTKYSINCLPTSLSNYSLPIGLKIKTDGNYNLSFAGLDTFANGIDLVLEDTKTGEMTTITSGVNIPFHFSSSDDPNRFVLHINGVTAVPNVNKTDGIQVFAYGHTVYLHGQQSLNGSVSIFNTLGQQVYTGVLNGAAKQQIRLNQQRGVYFVRLKENSHVITKKIFIQ